MAATLPRTCRGARPRTLKTPKSILELLNNLVHDSDVGILYITHDLLSARMLSDEVIVLNEGQVVEAGPSLRVIRQPEDEYTRRLLEAIPNPFQDAPLPGDSMAG